MSQTGKVINNEIKHKAGFQCLWRQRSLDVLLHRPHQINRGRTLNSNWPLYQETWHTMTLTCAYITQLPYLKFYLLKMLNDKFQCELGRDAHLDINNVYNLHLDIASLGLFCFSRQFLPLANGIFLIIIEWHLLWLSWLSAWSVDNYFSFLGEHKIVFHPC